MKKVLVAALAGVLALTSGCGDPAEHVAGGDTAPRVASTNTTLTGPIPTAKASVRAPGSSPLSIAGASRPVEPGAPPIESGARSGEPGQRPAGGPAADSFTVVAAGDLLVHPPLTRQAAADARAAGRTGHDFTRVLAGVRPLVSRADLAICHMETPLAPARGPFTGYPIFSVPPQLADAAAWAGFDTCSTASNHSLDTGLSGIRRTLDNLDRAGVRHAGTARSAQEAASPTILDVAGVKVAHLSYTFSFNGIPRPTGKRWAANLIDSRAIRAEAREARARGAEVVILSMHWGTEYQNAPDVGQRDLARRLLASPDIDLIVGHHAHVVQPIEKIGAKWVAYGLGNLVTRFPDGSPEKTQQAVVPEFTFRRTGAGRWTVTDVKTHPTWMEYYPAARVVDLATAVRNSRLSAARRARYAAIHRQIDRYLRVSRRSRGGD